jgi:UDPglucose 6-dehydrogenase
VTALTVGYAGMTHLGLMSAVAAAEKGCEVLCFDTDQALCDRLTVGDFPVVEPDLPETAARNKSRLRFTSKVGELARCAIVYLAPDVATDDAGTSDLTRLETLFARVEPVLSPECVLVILSQVPPGFTRTHAKPGRQLYYQVETLIFGRAMERSLLPERFIVGMSDPSRPLPKSFARYLELFGCPILPMRYESAELAKISINCCLVASVTVANTLAELCERIGADWSEIAPSLKLDRRIGPYSYLAPGLGIAGGNLERDLATVIRMADAAGTDAGVVKAWVANSRHRRDWPLALLVARGLQKARIGLLGLAYKENTHSVKNSPALALIAGLPEASLRAFDPVVPASVAPGVAQGRDALDALKDVDVAVIATPWPEFRKLSPASMAAAMRGRLLIDPYRVIEPIAASKAGLEHCTLGVAPTPPQAGGGSHQP